MPGLTQAEYARHRGVSRPAINKLVKSGRIPVEKDGTINAAKADFALGENRSRMNEPRQSAPAAADSNTGKLTLARAGAAYYDAKQRQLAYQKALGNVLPLAGVVDAATICSESLVRILTSLSMHAEAITAAAGREGVAGVRMALKLIERDMRTRAGSAFAQMAATASAARDETAGDPDAPPIDDEEEEVA